MSAKRPLLAPLTSLKGVGPKLAEQLQKLGIHNVEQALFHLPLRYEDRGNLVPMNLLRPNVAVLTQGTVVNSQIINGRKRSWRLTIEHEGARLHLVWFYFSNAQIKRLALGSKLRVFGQVRPGRLGLEIVHPESELIDHFEQPLSDSGIVAIYPATEGLQQKRLQLVIQQALDLLVDQGIDEDLPDDVIANEQLPTLKEAILAIHRPTDIWQVQALTDGNHPAVKRLALAELLAHQISLLRLRQQQKQFASYRFQQHSQRQQALLNSLPFKLTKAQLRVVDEITDDTCQATPMRRLVQGDVGSGKTLVAFMAMLSAVDAGYQAVLMAPTELLAEQHFQNINKMAESTRVRVASLLGKHTKKQKQIVNEQLANGDIDILIGTHAVFQPDITFQRLALVVIDEQHRFGVEQRIALMQKGEDASGRQPHQLAMTATPIPRTLAMTIWGDMDCSVIDELPPGRKPITTTVLADDRREAVMGRVAAAAADGKQIYWVNTLIEESEDDELVAESAERTAADMRARLPQVRIGLIHGRMKASDKQTEMEKFATHEYDVLVATTVIEVGVDVPNASVMVIENCERLGLSQLHQLRGRVGRGAQESYCVLLYHPPLSQVGKARLTAMRESQDGFYLSEQDLKLRGPGEVLGKRQTGDLNLRIAQLDRDFSLIEQAKTLSELLYQNSPLHCQRLTERWLPNAESFASV
ncbi:ATP-dependent DNA helicase RecG [Salinibius halmophilus]|uniref:ATP-dependent DNA helicase RecG n=1 Tax=Salinibius halmophilus TaxID=1853216 RepID=UPI0018F7B9DA|nr:ATP-dependent DNA helicase RecG [Salinibius halmophilus]